MRTITLEITTEDDSKDPRDIEDLISHLKDSVCDFMIWTEGIPYSKIKIKASWEIT